MTKIVCIYRVNRVVVRKGVTVAYRSLVTAGKMGVEDKTTIHIADVEWITKGVDSGDLFKSGDVRDESSQKPLKPNNESLGPSRDASIPVENLPVDHERRSTTTELMANPVQSTDAGSASGVSTDPKRNRKPHAL